MVYLYTLNSLKNKLWQEGRGQEPWECVEAGGLIANECHLRTRVNGVLRVPASCLWYPPPSRGDGGMWQVGWGREPWEWSEANERHLRATPVSSPAEELRKDKRRSDNSEGRERTRPWLFMVMFRFSLNGSRLWGDAILLLSCCLFIRARAPMVWGPSCNCSVKMNCIFEAKMLNSATYKISNKRPSRYISCKAMKFGRHI